MRKGQAKVSQARRVQFAVPIRASFAQLLIVTVFLLFPTTLQAQEPARLALVIGNQDYAAKVGPLKNPRSDAALIEASLRQLGFKVTVLKDASYKAMDSALKRYVTEVRRAGRNALSFFYYSGHGVANPETQINYLIPVDVSDAEDDRVWFESFQQNAIIDLLSKQASNATHYVVFDACRNELNIAGTAAKALGTDKGFVPITDTAGLLIAYATAPRKTASDIGIDGGPYAKVLAEELMKPGVEAVTMFRNVQLRVKQTIGQDPWLSFPSLPAVYFAGTKPPENVELKFWAAVKDNTDPRVLNTYLQRYPNGEFASTARALIERYERQLKVEQAAIEEQQRKRQEEARKAAEVKRLEEEKQMRDAALIRERQRTQEIKDVADAKRVEDQQRAEIAARTEELRKAQDAVRVAREAAAAAEQERVAAAKAAEEERLVAVQAAADATQAAEAAAKRAGSDERIAIAALPKLEVPTNHFNGNWTFYGSGKCQTTQRVPIKIVIRGTTVNYYGQRGVFTLRIDPSGSVRGTTLAPDDGAPTDWVGRLQGNSGSGTYVRRDRACSGVFTARRD